MSVHGITGAAGTGKTTRLFEVMSERLADAPLFEGQRVLALTFMHGSRSRLQARLAEKLPSSQFECLTLDRFAWEITRRWRTLQRERGLPMDALPGTGAAYDQTCASAADLLGIPAVARWVCRRHPVVVVDEFQDCRAERIGIVDGLSERAALFVAADEFQELDPRPRCDAIDWLRSMGHVEELSQVHRTTAKGLLAGATSLRAGTGLEKGTGLSIAALPAAAVAASWLAHVIRRHKPGDVVVITPTRAQKSPFVRGVLERIAEKPFVDRSTAKPFGPFPVRWETSADDLHEATLGELGLEDCAPMRDVSLDDLRGIAGPVGRALARWVDHQRRVLGRSTVAAGLVDAQVHRIVQRQRTREHASRRTLAMTVHQAKNREFRHVVVLWPRVVQGHADAQRRRLYNALTRARETALVLVECSTGERLGKPPFAYAP